MKIYIAYYESIEEYYMANINKREEICIDFNQLTEENQEYAVAILRGMVCEQNSKESVCFGRDDVDVELKN